MKRLASLVFAFLIPATAFAHKPSDSYLRMHVARDGALTAQWDIALADLEFAIGLDENDDDQITWAELKNRQAEVHAYALRSLKLLQHNVPIALAAAPLLFDTHTDGGYAVINLKSSQPVRPDEPIEIQYSLLFDLDSQHRGLTSIQFENAPASTAIFSASNRSLTIEQKATGANPLQFVREGIVHIWQGADHLLFLLSLLLPVALAGAIDKTALRLVATRAFKIVTAFTVAHSITLALAGLNIVHPPSRLVESIIAASVAIAAINNIYPLFNHAAWRIAFLFGLVHGFGFASVLADLAIPGRVPWRELLAFNAGVEIGQLAFVALILPIAFFAHQTWFYRNVALRAGSAAIGLIALAWTVERAFDLKIF